MWLNHTCASFHFSSSWTTSNASSVLGAVCDLDGPVMSTGGKHVVRVKKYEVMICEATKQSCNIHVSSYETYPESV